MKLVERGLSIGRLRELLEYDPDTGMLRRISPTRLQPVGWFPGFRTGRGYRGVYIAGTTFMVQRLAVAIVEGAWPEAVVDHEDRDPSNNRWRNLRKATQSQNRLNTITNRNLPKGVGAHGGRFHARIGHAGVRRHLGTFDTIAAASDAYMRAARELYGEFARAA